MIRKIFIIITFLTSIVCSAMEITFVTQTQEPIKDVSGIGYSVSNDSVGEWISNDRGVMEIKGEKLHYLITSKQGFSQRLIRLDSLPDVHARVILTPERDLGEVIVTPKDVEEFDTHTTYRLSEKDMARYTNVLQSLNEIPHLTVLSNGSVFFEGETNVRILVDGVEASLPEVQTLSKADIAKVNVYQNPPPRFLAQGVSSVIDIRLKSNIHGGNGAIELSQAFQSLKGDNSAALYYNYKQSRFSFRYGNENRHYQKHRKTEILDYDFDDIHYNKTKEGLDSRSHYDDNSINLTYQINKPQNFLYNVKAAVGFNRDGGTYNQRVTSNDESFLATNYLHSGFTNYMVGNYFEKNIGENSGSFIANINYRHYSTKYSSAYRESREDEAGFSGSHSDYKTHLDGIFSELQYQFPYSKAGYFYIGLFEMYKHSKYVDTTSPFYQTVNSTGAYGFWMNRINRIQWWLSMGVNWNHTASSTLSGSHNLWVPVPRFNLNWIILDNLRLGISYSFDSELPSIAQLSETNQWLDTRLVYHGNSTLKPYRTHSLRMNLVFNSKYVGFSLRPNFTSSPDMICDMYTLTDNYMLQTLVNLSSYRDLGAILDVTLTPLGSGKFVFWNRVIAADVRGKNAEYSWKGHRFQWMSTLSLNLEHWTFELYYQYPGKVAQGQLIRPRAQCWSVTAFYRPMTNLSVGLECFMPFGKGFKEREYTVNDAPVYSSTETNIKDMNNLISLKLSYNFSFGRNKNSARPQYDNGDNDSGILRK